MSAREFARLSGSERTAVISETDRIFRQRTGVMRQLDPDRDPSLIRQWIAIRDEVMTRNQPGTTQKPTTGAKTARTSGGGAFGLAERAVDSILTASPSINDLVNVGKQIGEHWNRLASNAPRWIQIARTQIGQREFRGSGFNPQILQYILTCSDNFDTGDYGWANKHDWQAWVQQKREEGLMIPNEKPSNQLKWLLDGEGRGANDEGFYWCAAFVNWCLRRAGVPGRDHGQVSKWKSWGTRLKEPHVGALLVMSRGGSSWGHIAFVDIVDGQWVRLGGNQSTTPGGSANAVSNMAYPRRVTALIWPPGVESPE